MPVIDPISVPPPIGAEHVIYSYEPERRPTIRYRSVPSLRTGEASTLGAARSSFRTDLARWLHLDRCELPSVTEHLEAVVAGMWVRTQVGAVHRDRRDDRMFLQTLLKDGARQHEWSAHLRAAESAGAAPVVIIVEPEDCVGAVLYQMAPQDVSWVTYSDPQDTLGWVAIYGAGASRRTRMPVIADDPALRGMEVHAFAKTFAGRRTVRVLKRKDNDR